MSMTFIENDVSKILASNIKYLRKKHNLTQPNLADILDVSPGTISDYELDKRLITFRALMNLSNYFDISIDYLLAIELNDENLSKHTRSHQTGEAEKTIRILAEDQTLIRFADKIFYCYYYETDVRSYNDGKEHNLFEGEIWTDKTNGTGTLDVIARFGSSDEYNYEGKLTYNGFRMYISLINPKRNESCLLAIPCIPSEKSYIGGAGGILSVSRGSDPMPCYQHIIVSSVKLNSGDIPKDVIDEVLKIDNRTLHCYFNSDLDVKIYRHIQKLTDWR